MYKLYYELCVTNHLGISVIENAVIGQIINIGFCYEISVLRAPSIWGYTMFRISCVCQHYSVVQPKWKDKIVMIVCVFWQYLCTYVTFIEIPTFSIKFLYSFSFTLITIQSTVSTVFKFLIIDVNGLNHKIREKPQIIKQQNTNE